MCYAGVGWGGRGGAMGCLQACVSTGLGEEGVHACMRCA